MKSAEFDYREGFRITPDAPPEGFAAKTPYIDYGTGPIDHSRYFLPEYMTAEWNKLWTKIWVLAGVESDLRERGDFFTFELRDESFLITRSEDGRIRAFYNVCPHRGLRLVQSEHGSVASGFTCPFHNWSFHSDGTLASITDRETFRSEVVCHNPGLTEVRCDIHAGFVFITMNDDAEPLADFLGVFGEHMRTYHCEERVVVRHTRVEVAANWKDGVDGFLEGYHFQAIHRQVLPMVDDYHVQQDLYPNGAARMIIPQLLPSPRLESDGSLNETLKAVMKDAALDAASFSGSANDVRVSAQLAKRARAAELGIDYSEYTDSQLTDSYVYSAFPNIITGAHPEAVSVYRFLPHRSDVGRMYFDTLTLYYPVRDSDGTYVIPGWMGIPPDADMSGDAHPEVETFAIGEDYTPIGELYVQDVDMMPLVHAGMRSRGFKGACLGEQEIRIRHFHAELDRYLDCEK
ncbi:MAG: hypothetical protein JWL96_2807 [Sphingomonas bacterium]|jgi:phenylpropionate dioxygenase-like ring-hydroxylating dioxygenase large terminal subunit|uniref:aromatic ring-hydroxylating dioxygenase subunit alpha n=1 Tax=Sphingomonas bacterium TaxID=1895847 RepID=UPI0026279166|nr:aromatic ring-hydroxylating dioxygenase subunit alpha [Sphingomonas bacterium]MDB5710737.1 hypothetical protein [Sphingomonas bacterium]